MKPSTIYRTIFSSILLFVLAIGNASAQTPEIFAATHVARLNGENETTPNNSVGIGVGLFKLDVAARTLEYRISVAGLTNIIGAHFHRGLQTDPAGPVAQGVDHSGFSTTGTITGTWSNISNQDLSALMNDSIYFNVHTTAFQAGEIRGQVERMANATTLSVDASQETDPVTSQGEGYATLWIDEANSRADYFVAWSNLTGPATAAHFHLGPTGVAGGPVHTITLTSGQEYSAGTWENISPAHMTALKAGGIYVNIHTGQYSKGEIRGQVYPLDFYGSGISSAHEVPAAPGAEAIGTGYTAVLRLSEFGGFLNGEYVVGNLTGDVNAAHLHVAPKGEFGGVFRPLEKDDLIAGGRYWSIGMDILPELIDGDTAALMQQGLVYVNFHTTAHTSGEARGQLVPAANNLSVGTSAVRVEHRGVATFDAIVDRSGTIRFALPESLKSERGSIEIFSSLGDRVGTIALDESGPAMADLEVANGVYFARLVVAGRMVGTCRFLMAH